MKKKVTALLVGIFTLVISDTYAQAPTVSISATPSGVCAGKNVVFTNSNTNSPTSWTWYFPGGNPSTFTSYISPGNPPPIMYNYPGVYSVSCVVRNSFGVDSVYTPTSTQSNLIVIALPTATINPPSGGICDTGENNVIFSVDDTVHFFLTDTTKGNTYTWGPPAYTTPGGTVLQDISCINCPNPKAFPYVNTVYTLTVQNPAGCTRIYTDTVRVGDTNIKATITGRDSICAGTYDTLTAGGGATKPQTKYLWSNGKTTSSIIINPTATTTYNVKITTGLGCISSTSFTVNTSPIPRFTLFDHPDSVCYPGADTIVISPRFGNPYKYSWYGPPNGRQDTDILIVSPATTTTYTLVAQNIGCHYDSLIKIKVNSPPNVHFTTGATNLCLGSTTIITVTGGTQYLWCESAGFARTASVDVKPPASITYTVQVSDGKCFKDTTFTVHVDTFPTVRFKGDTSICVGQSTTIYVVPGYEDTYLWTYNNSTADSIVVPNTEPAGKYEYYVKVTKGACEKDSSAITVKVYPKPKPAILPLDTTVCEFDSVQLIASGGDYYLWKPKKSGLNHYSFYGNPGDTDRNNAAPLVQTIYTVSVCTWGCCKDTTAKINLRPNVQGAKVCCNDTVSGGTPVQLSATYDNTGPYQIQDWYPATGLSCTNCANPTATIYSTTTYVVTFLDNSISSGCTLQDSVTIDIFNCSVFVPNVFSPGQEVNGVLYVRSLCVSSMNFAIFDRYGNKIYETQNQNDGWDGTYKGKPMNMGTYVWYLTGLMKDGTTIAKSGNVTLLR